MVHFFRYVVDDKNRLTTKPIDCGLSTSRHDWRPWTQTRRYSPANDKFFFSKGYTTAMWVAHYSGSIVLNGILVLALIYLTVVVLMIAEDIYEPCFTSRAQPRQDIQPTSTMKMPRRLPSQPCRFRRMWPQKSNKLRT